MNFQTFNRLESKRCTVWIGFLPGGNSSMVVNELQNRLFRLGCRISASSDHAMNLMIAAASSPGDVVFGSSFSGRNAELVHCFGVLRERGTPTIALTQSGTPVAQAADLVIGVNLPEGVNIFRPTSTRFAYLAVVDIGLPGASGQHCRVRKVVGQTAHHYRA